MWYKLNEKNEVIPCGSNEFNNRQLFKFKIEDTTISTVFLGFDHDYNTGRIENYQPLVFETMIFSKNKEIDNMMYRSRTYKEAMLKHLAVVRGIKKRYENNK